jgi:hypothetical protein
MTSATMPADTQSLLATRWHQSTPLFIHQMFLKASRGLATFLALRFILLVGVCISSVPSAGIHHPNNSTLHVLPYMAAAKGRLHVTAMLSLHVAPLLLLVLQPALQSAKRQEVADIIEALEALNPLQQPTQHLDQLAGKWVLLYTTITITVSSSVTVAGNTQLARTK